MLGLFSLTVSIELVNRNFLLYPLWILRILEQFRSCNFHVFILPWALHGNNAKYVWFAYQMSACQSAATDCHLHLRCRKKVRDILLKHIIRDVQGWGSLRLCHRFTCEPRRPSHHHMYGSHCYWVWFFFRSRFEIISNATLSNLFHKSNFYNLFIKILRLTALYNTHKRNFSMKYYYFYAEYNCYLWFSCLLFCDDDVSLLPAVRSNRFYFMYEFKKSHIDKNEK